ncbi:MAG: hypothetical protein V7767_03905 [Leeuwenhoekiella sp.]
MKIKYFKSIFLFLLTTSLVFANNTGPVLKGRYTKEKKIKKEYNVNTNALLKINNSYGNVDITSWSENRIVIEVTIKTNGNNEEKVAEKLNDIDVDFEASAGFVSAITRIGKDRNNSWWNSWNNSSNVNMEINYLIKMPITNSVDLNNDYGGIFLNKLEGQAKISCDYGKLELGELMADNNYLNFDYTNNSTIGYMKSGKINADYSAFTLEKAENVELNADYTKSSFNSVKNLNYDCDYGSVTAEQIGKITGRGDYLSVKFGSVSGDVNINADYGSIKIDELTAKAGDVVIQSDYAGIKLGYSADYNFRFSIKLEYAGLGGEEDFEINKQRIESSDKFYEGYYGSASAKNSININSEYGGVTFNKIN